MTYRKPGNTMYKRILVALSGTPFTTVAVRYALELAARHEAQVTGLALRDNSLVQNVGAVPLGGSAAAEGLIERRVQEIEQRIDTEVRQFELTCQRAGIEPKVVRKSEEAGRVLTDLWRYNDLTIIGLRGLFEYGVVKNPTDVVARLISQRVRPILAVAHDYRPIRRVLVAYNGSMGSASAFKSFIRSQLWSDFTVKIVVFNRDDEAHSLLTNAAEYCAAYGHEVKTEHVKCSAPRDELLAHAYAWDADMIVMGARSRTHFIDHILGSMTTQVLRNAEIPIYLTA
jgi:nucleotide-binding universal stress UspA family protein